MIEVGIKEISKLQELEEEERNKLKEFIRFKFYFYARPSFADMRREIKEQLGVDCLPSFLRLITRQLIASDLNNYNKFMDEEHASIEFTARRWAVLNYCAKLLENPLVGAKERIGVLNLFLKTVKLLEAYYVSGEKRGGDMKTNARHPFAIQPEEVKRIQEEYGNMGRRLKEPLALGLGADEESSEGDEP